MPWLGGASTSFGAWEVNLEPWAGTWAAGNGDASRIVLQGNQRGYLTRRGRSAVQYASLFLLGKTLRYTVDVSRGTPSPPP